MITLSLITTINSVDIQRYILKQLAYKDNELKLWYDSISQFNSS